MEKGLDTGPVAMSAATPIGPDETTADLHDRLAALGAELMARALEALEAGTFATTAQAAEGVTYARKIDKAEARIDWSRPARAIHDTARGLSPFPGAWCEATIGGTVERLKVLRTTLTDADQSGRAPAPGEILDASGAIACGEGAIRLIEIQRAGGKALPAEVVLRGAKLGPGDRLG